MVTVENIQKLSKEELRVLQSLIGQSLIWILCPGVDLYRNLSRYDFPGIVSLKFYDKKRYLAFTGVFDETNFGDDIHVMRISEVEQPVDIKTTEDGALLQPCASVNVHSGFMIKKIEVYGESYVQHSENRNPDTLWLIGRNHPGEPISERVETEHVLVFYSRGVRMLIVPHSATPFITISFDSKFIRRWLSLQKGIRKLYLKKKII